MEQPEKLWKLPAKEIKLLSEEDKQAKMERDRKTLNKNKTLTIQ